MIRTVRLPLTQRPAPYWTDAFATPAAAETPFLIQGAKASLQFALFTPAGDALASVSGLSLITCQIYARRWETTAIIAPAVFSGTLQTALTLEQWTANTAPYYHFNFELTAAQTAIAIEDEATSRDAWVEVYATHGGDRVSLGSGPLRIHRSAAGGADPATGSTYYTAAQVDALLSARAAAITDHSADGYITITVAGASYNVPVVTPG